VTKPSLLLPGAWRPRTLIDVAFLARFAPRGSVLAGPDAPLRCPGRLEPSDKPRCLHTAEVLSSSLSTPTAPDLRLCREAAGQAPPIGKRLGKAQGASVGSRGDSCDNALADDHRPVQDRADPPAQPMEGIDDIGYAALEWVDWFNHRRLLEPIGHLPPTEFEATYRPANACACGAAGPVRHNRVECDHGRLKLGDDRCAGSSSTAAPASS